MYYYSGTSHRSNIFCADFVPGSRNSVISCAADGTLKMNDLTNPRFGEVHLLDSENLIHMFTFAIDQPNIIFTAEECGKISRVDMRTKRSEALYVNKRYDPQRRLLVGSVKSLVQSPCLGASQVFRDKYSLNLIGLS